MPPSKKPGNGTANNTPKLTSRESVLAVDEKKNDNKRKDAKRKEGKREDDKDEKKKAHKEKGNHRDDDKKTDNKNTDESEKEDKKKDGKKNESSATKEFHSIGDILDGPYPMDRVWKRIHGEVTGRVGAIGTRFCTKGVLVDSEIETALRSIRKKNVPVEKDETVEVCAIPVDAIHSLSRANRCLLLRKLADEELADTVKVEVYGSSRKFEGKLLLSTILVLSVAMRAEEPKILAELVGLATPETVLELTQFLRPPLITLESLSTLIHCAARSITPDSKHPHRRSPNPVLLVCSIAEAIAAVIATSEIKGNEREGEKEPGKENKQLKTLLSDTFLRAKNDQDRGCQIGILVAGVQHYVRNGTGKIDDRLEKTKTVLDFVTGMLGGTPVAGFVFAPVGSIIKYFLHRRSEKKKEELTKVLDGTHAVKTYFCQAIRGPIFLQGRLVVKKDGKEEVVEVDRRVFIEWYQEMLEWVGD